MPTYDYRATDAQGLTKTGKVEAASEEFATDTLTDKGLTVISLTEAKGRSLLEFELPFFNKVPIKDIVIFSRQFAVLMGAKVPVVSAIRTVAKQTRNPKLVQMLLDIADEAEAGTSLSVAMAKHPKAFSNFFVNMIRSGETTGRLESVMNYLADQMEKDYDLMTRIKGAMIYPIFIIIGLVIVGFIMMVFVVPKLTEVLKESGAALPWTTRLLIGTSDFMKKYAVQLVIAGILGGIGFRYWVNTDDGRNFWDALKLRIPIFGPLLRSIYLIRFTRSVSTLITGGVDIPASLDVCAELVGNAKFRSIILATKKEVMDGNSITTIIINEEKFIPKMVPQMMSVGEETGRLSEVLDKLTDFYSRELDNSVANLVSAIEPLIMMVMGLAVGIMVAAIILPMYNLATQF